MLCTHALTFYWSEMSEGLHVVVGDRSLGVRELIAQPVVDPNRAGSAATSELLGEPHGT